MKYSVLALFLLVIAAALIAGCTQGPAPAVPVSTTAMPSSETPASQVSFTLGDHFFEKKYSWQDDNAVYSEMFVVAQGEPWGIGYVVTPLSDDPAKCWYEVTVIDMNNPSGAKTFGFGRGHGTELNQVHPVYGYGSYKVEMRGNYVKVDMKAAKRNA